MIVIDTKIINNLENLRKIRESKKITQVKLSMDLGVSQELISRYEVGNSFPQPNMLIKLANYFNCSVDYLLGLTDITTPVKYLTNSNHLHENDIMLKYNSLSNEDRKYFNRFLTFLLENNSNNQAV